MSVAILSNKKNRSAVVHFSKNGTLDPNYISSPGERVVGFKISKLFWGIEPGSTITLIRNSNLIAVLDTTGFTDYSGNGLLLDLDPTASLEVEFTGSDGYLILEVKKDYIDAEVILFTIDKSTISVDTTSVTADRYTE